MAVGTIIVEAFITIINVASQSGQNVAAPLLMKALEPKLDEYAVLLLLALSYPIFFVPLLIGWGAAHRIHSRSYQPFWFGWPAFWRCFLTGLPNAFNGIFVILAGPMERTPVLVQAIAGNACIIFSIPLTKLIMRKMGTRRYFQFLPMLSVGTVLAGIVVSLIPTFMSAANPTPVSGSADGEGGASCVFWSLVFITGMAFASLYNVMEMWHLAKLEIELKTLDPEIKRDKVGEKLNMLTIQCVSQVLFIVVFMWLDFIPFIGSASSGADFRDKTSHVFACAVGAGHDCGLSPLYAFIFAAGYIIAYITAAYLNEKDANYTLLIQVMCPIVVSIFWLIFPELNSSASKTPLWSVIPSLILCTTAVLIWKYWEHVEEKKKGHLLKGLTINNSRADYQSVITRL